MIDAKLFENFALQRWTNQKLFPSCYQHIYYIIITTNNMISYKGFCETLKKDPNHQFMGSRKYVDENGNIVEVKWTEI